MAIHFAAGLFSAADMIVTPSLPRRGKHPRGSVPLTPFLGSPTPEMIYFKPFTGSVCPFPEPFSGSSRNSANAPQKYRFNRLFPQNNYFTSDLTVQFSGLRLVAFSATPFQVMGGEIGDGKGHCCQKMKSRRRIC